MDRTVYDLLEISPEAAETDRAKPGPIIIGAMLILLGLLAFPVGWLVSLLIFIASYFAFTRRNPSLMLVASLLGGYGSLGWFRVAALESSTALNTVGGVTLGLAVLVSLVTTVSWDSFRLRRVVGGQVRHMERADAPATSERCPSCGMALPAHASWCPASR